MIRALILAALLAGPGLAQTPAPFPAMTPEACRESWQSFSAITDQNADLAAARPDVTGTGWCRIDHGNAPLGPKDFDRLDWRAIGLDAALVNGGLPAAFEARFEGIDLVQGWKLALQPAETGSTPGSLTLAARHDAAQRSFAIDDVTATFGDLGRVTLSGEGAGIDLSSLKAMQLGLGGLRVHAGALRLDSTPALIRGMVPGLDTARALALVASLPDDSIDSTSRAALAAFAQQAQTGPGRLHLSVRSDGGIGVLQMVGGAMQIGSTDPSAPAPAEALAVLLSGVVLTATWTAGN